MIDKKKRAQSLVGFNPEGRPEDDFYPTPAIATEKLLSVEDFPDIIWECACGAGNISRVLNYQGHTTYDTDLNYRGFGETTPVNFLEVFQPPIEGIRSIITNPPFRLYNKFIKACVNMQVEKFALFGKMAALASRERVEMLKVSGLKKAWIFEDRLTLTRNGEPTENGGMMDFLWLIWENGWNKAPEIGWI